MMSLMSNSQAIVESGIISNLRRTFGFISCPSRVRDVFFHHSALEDCIMEQLQEGTAVIFIAERDDTGKVVARRMRLAPVGTRVRLVQLEPGVHLGHVSDPATASAKGVIRFLSDGDVPEHLLYDATDISPAPPQPTATAPSTSTPEPFAQTAASATAQPLPAPAAPQLLHPPQKPPDPPLQQPADGPPKPPHPLGKGQLVFFRICTDLRAAQQAREATAHGSQPPARRLAYQRAVEVRPAGEADLAPHPHLMRQAVLLELLNAALQVSQEAKAEAAPGR